MERPGLEELRKPCRVETGLAEGDALLSASLRKRCGLAMADAANWIVPRECEWPGSRIDSLVCKILFT